MTVRPFLPATALAAVLALAPAFAQAHQTCYPADDHHGSATGAVVGALAGGVIGSNLAARHHRDSGTVAGAVLGGVIGSQVGKSADGVRCYDDDQSYNDNQSYDDDGYRPDGDDRYPAGYDRHDTYADDRPGGDYVGNGYYGAYAGQPAYGSSYDDGYNGGYQSDDYASAPAYGYNADDGYQAAPAWTSSSSYASGPYYSSTGWTQVPGDDCASVCVTQDNGYANQTYYKTSVPDDGHTYFYSSATPASYSGYDSGYTTASSYGSGDWNDDDDNGWSDVDHHHHHRVMGFRDDRGQWHVGGPRAIGWQDQDGRWHQGQVIATGWRDEDGNWHQDTSSNYQFGSSDGY